jgi:hypothetical protein
LTFHGPQPLIPVTVIPTPDPDWVFVQPEGEPRHDG